jgi:cytidine deaminase
MERNINISYTLYNDDSALSTSDKSLLTKARAVTEQAYAPYSKFLVGACGLLQNGEQVVGTNQENASYPVGICAERTLLSTAASTHPAVAIETIAISYNNTNGTSSKPITPCGVCRQTLVEYEGRQQQPIRLIMSGLDGKVIIVESAGSLLPLSFGSADLL